MQTIPFNSGPAVAPTPTGIIVAYPGLASPDTDEYLLADGAAHSRTTYADLFDLIGETFGPGDGSTTFNVPDLTDRFIKGREAEAIGTTGGAAAVTLSAAQTGVPPHSHALSGSISGESSHTHGVGSLVAAGESSHTHGVGTLAAGNESSHTHGDGTLAVASHTHADGTLATATATSPDLSAKQFAFASPAAATAVFQAGTNRSGLASAGGAISFTVAADLTHSHDVTGATGSASPDVTGSTGAGSAHTHSLSGSTAAGSSHTHTLSGDTGAGSSHTHAHTLAVDAHAGTAADPHENRPPYIALSYLIKT